MSDLEFRVLGLVEVWRGDEPVVFGQGASLSLLAGLLALANTVVAGDKAAEFVWGDRQPRHPRAALQTKVSRLRGVLGHEVIETVPGGYRLRADSDQLDLLRFDDLMAAAADAASDIETLGALEEAIGLWRGTPLSNVNSAILQSEIVPRLTERHIAACEAWAEVCLRMGRPAPVAERLAPLVAAHPHRESLTGLLMLARYRAGRSADALAAYDAIRRALRDELGVDPGRALQDLHLMILRATSGEPAARIIAGSEPAPWLGRGPSPGGLVGRDTGQQMLAASLRSHPAVTVVGTAGVGKTELALHTASQLAAGFADGVAVAELGTMPPQDTDDMLAVSGLLLGTLGIPADPARPGWEGVLDWLRPRELLLILDNAEHVYLACSRLADLIARSCTSVKVITTSRRPLGFAGERVITLSRLDPEAAAELLLRRVSERGSDAGLRADPAGVAELCQLLDGLPLALELAAARLRTMSLAALTERIAIRPDLLAIESRPGLAHQRGLFDTLRWSYNLLAEPARLLLTRLAVFAGTFSLTDAEQVCGAAPFTEAEVAEVLSALAEDSLVHVTGGHDYRLLVPVREFAVSNADDTDLAATRARHLRHFRAAAECIEGADADAWQRIITRLTGGYHEILAALEWALRDGAAPHEAEDGVRLLLAAQPVWERHHGAILGALAHANRALRYADALPTDLMASLLLTAGHLNYRTMRLDAAKPLLERVRQVLDDQNPAGRRERATALSFLSAIAYARVEPQAADLIRESADDARNSGAETAPRLMAVAAEMLAALGHVDEAVALVGEAGRRIDRAQRLWPRFLTRRAIVYLRVGRVAEAMADLDDVRAAQQQMPTYDRASAVVTRGYALGRQGRYDEARDTLTEGLRLVDELQAITLLPDMNQALATTETLAGNLASAARYVRAVLDWALPHASVIDLVGALHLAVVLAARLDSPRAGVLAAAVRDCRLATGLPTWPLPAADYASYEAALGGQAGPPEPGTGPPEQGTRPLEQGTGPLDPGTLARVTALAMSVLAGPGSP